EAFQDQKCARRRVVYSREKNSLSGGASERTRRNARGPANRKQRAACCGDQPGAAGYRQRTDLSIARMGSTRGRNAVAVNYCIKTTIDLASTTYVDPIICTSPPRAQIS